MGDFKKTNHKRREGRCFELAGKYVLSLENSDKYLVHGTVCHESRQPMAHAWVENEEGKVYDLIKNEIYWGMDFYNFYNAQKMFVYTQKEAAINMAEYGTYGPWEQSVRDADHARQQPAQWLGN